MHVLHALPGWIECTALGKDDSRDLDQCRESFQTSWAEQAKIWVAVLDGVEKLKQVDLEIEEKKREALPAIGQ